MVVVVVGGHLGVPTDRLDFVSGHREVSMEQIYNVIQSYLC